MTFTNAPMNHRASVLSAIPSPQSSRTLLKQKAGWGLLLVAIFTGLCAGPSFVMGAESETGSAIAAKTAEEGTPSHEQEEHGLSQKAVEIGHLFGFPLTNSMMVSWIVALGLIVFAQFATRDMKGVPQGAQTFLEGLVESLARFLAGLLVSH